MHQYMAQRVTYARPQNRATTAAAVAHAGIKMLKKFTTGFTSHGGARVRPDIIDEIHDQWCRDNGYPVPKPTSSQAQRRKNSSHKLRAQAGLQSSQAQGSGNQGTSVQAGPGHKQPG